jgi:predicted nucleic acid-binding protein
VAQLILDTAVLIAVERGRLSLTDLGTEADDIALAAVSAAELWFGVEMADDAHQAQRASFVNGIIEQFRVEGYDLEVARVHGRLLAETRRLGRPRGSYDLIIAATSVARNRIVVTMDKGFAELPGVQVRLVG